MASALNIERPAELLHYLRERGHLVGTKAPVMTNLAGGVSNRTVLVEWPDGPAWVIKQALAKLRVATDWFSDPDRIHREALGLIWLAKLAPAGTITPLVFEDRPNHLVAMQAVPHPHENWKNRLLGGAVESDDVRQFAQLLGTIHRRAREHQDELRPLFDDRIYFETLRIDPYYRYTASLHPAAAGFYSGLIEETFSTRLTLVHGDYSPKNILVCQEKLILLDHEVIHFGDPAFDLGFSLTHLLSKAHHVKTRRDHFLQAARLYWQTYQQTAGDLAALKGLEARVARHTLGCLLARVDGRSPLEYLSESERHRQRRIVLSLMEGFDLQRMDAHWGHELGRSAGLRPGAHAMNRDTPGRRPAFRFMERPSGALSDLIDRFDFELRNVKG